MKLSPQGALQPDARGAQLTPRGDLYVTFWTLAAERQRIFEARVRGEPPQWTDDAILRRYAFCNAFRASDRVSQYLIQRVIHGVAGVEAEDTILRAIVFRLFSRPATWELIEAEADPVRMRSFDSEWIATALDRAIAGGERLYTGAFAIPARGAYGHDRRHRNHLALVDDMLRDHLPERIARARRLSDVYEALLRFPSVGPFVAYQVTIDVNYAPQFGFGEDELVVLGPRSLRGVRKLFRDLGDRTPEDAVLWLVEQQERVGESIGIPAPTLFGRRLHVPDVLNLLCELDRYTRIASPAHSDPRLPDDRCFVPSPSLPPLFYPPAWGLNDRVPAIARGLPPAFDLRVGGRAPVAPLG